MSGNFLSGMYGNAILHISIIQFSWLSFEVLVTVTFIWKETGRVSHTYFIHNKYLLYLY